ncbi:hypothetical protein CEXT_400941 [Caerostris extrusa]|uniref:Uncharacterized protein n=1 Tax=Caerostris extrusa TaxID=172846 RepID=A0AAV4WEC8_CAEEX|nr:hypothetical protein CEXT_400941 [Caerostris extrusa]
MKPPCIQPPLEQVAIAGQVVCNLPGPVWRSALGCLPPSFGVGTAEAISFFGLSSATGWIGPEYQVRGRTCGWIRDRPHCRFNQFYTNQQH